MALTTDAKSRLSSLAKQGDATAKALLEGNSDIKLTKGAEAANVIKVTGQVTDALGNAEKGVRDVLVESFPIAGAGTMTDGGAGTIKSGSGTKQVWLQTDAAGKFELDVLNATAEDTLIRAVAADGDVQLLKLTFA